MEETIGYGVTRRREAKRPVFVVRGSETVATIGDEGWEHIEREFFVSGVVREENLALLPRAQAKPRVWLWALVSGVAALLSLTAGFVVAILI